MLTSFTAPWGNGEDSKFLMRTIVGGPHAAAWGARNKVERL